MAELMAEVFCHASYHPPFTSFRIHLDLTCHCYKAVEHARWQFFPRNSESSGKIANLVPRASDSVSALAALAVLIPWIPPPFCVQLVELSSALSDFFSSHKLTDQE